MITLDQLWEHLCRVRALSFVARGGKANGWTGTGSGLEHLRFGEDHPVYLFDLALAGEREWRSVSPHLCREDCYSAVLIVGDDNIVLRWSVNGPRKQETIEYVYSLETTHP